MKKIAPLIAPDTVITVPGSKSLTQRALIAAALAAGTSRLSGALDSEDTRYTAQALRQLGIRMTTSANDWEVTGCGGAIQLPAADIYLGNNGTATRFLTSVAALGNGEVKITGDQRMSERPIQPLLDALHGWGVNIRSIHDNGCPPLAIRAAGITGGHTLLPEGRSSQYLSSLLLVAPYAASPAELEVAGDILSKPYVAMTLAVMAEFGITAKANPGYNLFQIPRGIYRAREYAIEGDASNASYFFAAAAVTGGRITVDNVPSPSLQGDAAFVDLLEAMGCGVAKTATGITVSGPAQLQGIEADMADMPDVAPTLAIVAAMAKGRTTIRNIAHLRIKECDRLHVMAVELAKLGVTVQELDDTLIIEGTGTPVQLHGAAIKTYNDHRIAMSFAVAGLAIPGITILDEECVAKSFPDFWERFQLLYSPETTP